MYGLYTHENVDIYGQPLICNTHISILSRAEPHTENLVKYTPPPSCALQLQINTTCLYLLHFIYFMSKIDKRRISSKTSVKSV